MSLKKLNPKTEYEVVPSYSVLIIQGMSRVMLTAEEIARLHVESSVAPDVLPEHTFVPDYDAEQDGSQA